MTFDITKYKPEELQTRDGLNIACAKEIAPSLFAVMVTNDKGYVGAYKVNKEGISLTSPTSSAPDTILKPKKPKLLAPAIVLSTDGVRVPQVLFSTIEEATEYCHRYYAKAEKVIWPAIPNKDGYYEIPEEEAK